MRVSYEWLKSMVDVPADPAELVAEFTRTGTEVEAVEKVGANLEHVVTAQVVSKKPHPDSDHMWLCQVSVGDKNVDADGNPVPLQIVCGAQNFNEGDHIVTAMIGAVLPGDFKIKKSKLRGVESCGMNCSARELGLGADHEGIMILPPDAPVGMDFTDYLGTSDTVIVDQRKPKLPWQLHGLLTASWHERGPSWGVMLTLFRRHGFFVHGQSDLRRTGPTPQTCDREGFLPGSAVKPYYTGKTRQSSYAVTAGMAHRLRPWLSVFYGAGYGRSAVAWQLAESEGGGYVLNGGLSRKGMAAEAGLVFSVKRVSLAASTLTVAGRQWQIGIGVGIRLGNQKE